MSEKTKPWKIRAIKRCLRETELSVAEIAEQLELCPATVYRIKREMEEEK